MPPDKVNLFLDQPQLSVCLQNFWDHGKNAAHKYEMFSDNYIFDKNFIFAPVCTKREG